MFDVNVFAVITVTQAFAPLLIASRGTIINIGSIAGNFPMPWQGYYNASKAAVNLLISQLRIELAPFNVNAICVITGGIKTKFFENQPPTKVPESSLYYPGREEIEFIENGGIAEQGAWNVDDYAREVVKNALKKNPKVDHWVGGSARMIWLAGLLWSTFWVRVSTSRGI
jgi:1-acylglycerone phosphate reductase